MRVFMTGATGYVGGAVATRLTERGHDVTALVRPQTDSKSLRDRGAVIVGDGRNRWAMVNLHDLSDCYLRIAESRTGGVLHAIDDMRATLDECARAVAPAGRIEHVPVDQARKNMGPLTDALIADQRVSSEAPKGVLGWKSSR